MKVLANTELQNRTGANASDRSTRHIEIQLPANASYRVGDHLSVVPRNDPVLVDSVARRFGFCRRIRSGCRSPKAVARNCRSAMRFRSDVC